MKEYFEKRHRDCRDDGKKMQSVEYIETLLGKYTQKS